MCHPFTRLSLTLVPLLSSLPPFLPPSQADYRDDGREELICCSVDGEVRGYLPTIPDQMGGQGGVGEGGEQWKELEGLAQTACERGKKEGRDEQRNEERKEGKDGEEFLVFCLQ